MPSLKKHKPKEGGLFQEKERGFYTRFNFFGTFLRRMLLTRKKLLLKGYEIPPREAKVNPCSRKVCSKTFRPP